MSTRIHGKVWIGSLVDLYLNLLSSAVQAFQEYVYRYRGISCFVYGVCVYAYLEHKTHRRICKCTYICTP